MKPTRLQFLAAASVLVASIAGAAHSPAATRPRYGGTLRVEVRAYINSMDPRDWYLGTPDSAASERLLTLVFDRLVELDSDGRLIPALAIGWQHDASFTHWQFVLRDGVKFHDGSPLTPEAVAAALQAEIPERWHVAAADHAVAFTFAEPHPQLLNELVAGRSFVFRAVGDTVIGTGPFRIAEWQPQQRLVLTASEDHWAGRPYLDRIEIGLGIALQQQYLDLGKTDVAELAPNLLRRVEESGARVSVSSPVEVLALTGEANGLAAQNARLVQALSLSIDRAAIVSVLLQRQGEPAGSLLPQWLSGYAFAFSTEPDLTRAKQLRGQLSGSPALTLVYDAADALAMQVAQRVAVNARDAGITITVAAESRIADRNAPKADLSLVRLRLVPPDAEQALGALLAQSEPSASEAPQAALSSPQERYAAERVAVDDARVIPLAFVPELYAVNPAVKDWRIPRWGGWDLASVWLDRPETPIAPKGNGR
jgi:peptide/nickel transport system substrate-binding protein